MHFPSVFECEVGGRPHLRGHQGNSLQGTGSNLACQFQYCFSGCEVESRENLEFL